MLGILPATLQAYTERCVTVLPKKTSRYTDTGFAHFLLASHPPFLATYNNLHGLRFYSQDTDDEEDFPGGLVDDGSSDDSEDDAPRNRCLWMQICDVIPMCHSGML